MLTPGTYITKYGSEVTIRDKGGVIINFDWFEERGACDDCKPEVDSDDELLIWECEYCDGGSAKLEPCKPNNL